MSDKTLMERLRDGYIAGGTCAGAVIGSLINEDLENLCVGNTCRNCLNEMMNKLADAIEREYLPRPRYEDGEPVQFGDMAEVRGDLGDVFEILYQDGKCVEVGLGGDGATHYMSYDGERLKRPQPEQDVLDADGVPINVGDTVYVVDKNITTPIGNKEVVESIENGIVFTDQGGWDGTDLSHKEPDSLAHIEEDTLMAPVDYCEKYGLLDSECNAEEGDEAVRHCTDCGLTCETRMVKHILRRQREVLERGNIHHE